MDRKVFLLAEEADFEQLCRQGALPRGFYRDHQDPEPAWGQRPPPIVRISPEELAPRERSGDPLEEERSDVLFASLLARGVLCRIAVVAGESAAEGPGPLRELIEWYERFHEECLRRLDYRRGELEEVLVLVLAGHVPPAWRADLTELLGRDTGAGPKGPVYLMGRRLNFDAADVCHARHVWPIAVSRLLVRLLASPPRGPADERGKELRAWRSIELVGLEPSEFDGQCEQGIRRSWQQLLEKVHTDGEDPPGYEPEARAPPKPVLETPLHIPASKGPWARFPVEREVDACVDETAWRDCVERAAERYRRELSASLLSVEPSTVTAAHELWRGVHRSPAAVDTALRAKGLASGPDLGSQLDRMRAQWQKIAAREADRDEAVEAVRGCAEHVAEAQAGYVELGARAFVGLAVTMLIGWAVLWVFWEVFDTLEQAAVLTVVAAGGSLLAALVPAWLENRAGRRAVEAFGEHCLPPVQKHTEAVHRAKLDTVDLAAKFWHSVNASLIAGKLVRLLRRLQKIVHGELHTSRERVRESRATDARSFGSDPLSQRAAFLGETRRMVAELSLTELEPEIATLVPAQAGELQARWQSFAAARDQRLRGNLPVAELSSLLDGFREGFRAALARRMHVAIGQVRSSWSLDEALKELRRHPFLFGLSVPAIGHHFEEDLRVSLAVLRDDLDVEPSFLERVGCERVDVVGDLPVIGFFFDEVVLVEGFLATWMERDE